MEESIYLPEDINEQPVEVELTKPRKKKVYTAPRSEKQLEGFERAKQIRLEKIKQKKLEDQEKIIKQILDNEKKIKINEKQVKKSQKPQKVEKLSLPVDEASSSDSSSDEEIIIKSKPKSKPKKPKKKTVVYLSESDSEEEIPVQKTRVQRRVPVQQPKPDIVKPTENTYKPIEYKNFFM
jgi:hypothetical protein